ncbi:MAG TPA: HNH endonuclease signature motif containing protein, partial [Patescibacteria group bacterium]|nr:HNH endonuclease signature motif containing protein [Patescibacteria group bacterium]
YLERHSPEERIKRRNTRKGRERRKNDTPDDAIKQSSDDGASKRNHNLIKDTPHPGNRSRYIPQEIRDKVFARDGGRCTFIGPSGRRCDCRWNLQVDHIIPFAKGGRNAPDNLRLLCAKHNRLAAEKEYGPAHMEKFHRRE